MRLKKDMEGTSWDIFQEIYGSKMHVTKLLLQWFRLEKLMNRNRKLNMFLVTLQYCQNNQTYSKHLHIESINLLSMAIFSLKMIINFYFQLLYMSFCIVDSGGERQWRDKSVLVLFVVECLKGKERIFVSHLDMLYIYFHILLEIHST